MDKRGKGLLQEENREDKENTAKPFVKWAGGKRQLIPVIKDVLPFSKSSEPFTYVEPFIGGGAVMFWVLQNYAERVKKAVINDVNADLVNVYATIKESPAELLEILAGLESTYKGLLTSDAQKEMFLEIRESFNRRQSPSCEHAAYFIFLNKTCFNGLYRVNGKNKFNVPFGKFKNPNICDESNILNASQLLQKVEILNGDYSKTLDHVEGPAFFYFDPPYKPLSQTASFNAYAMDVFNDNEQRRLKEFCDRLTEKNIKWLLSNSDPRNIEEDNNFFDELYSAYAIQRVKAKRTINSNATKRGKINELLITNYS